MRQSGILAAGCLYGLEHNLARLAEDHENARLWRRRMSELPGVGIDLQLIETNIVIFEVESPGRWWRPLPGRSSSRW